MAITQPAAATQKFSSNTVESSGRFYEFTLDGSTDLDLVYLAGGPSRNIANDGNTDATIVVVPENPFDSSNPNTTITLRYGASRNLKINKIIGSGSTSGAIILVSW